MRIGAPAAFAARADHELEPGRRHPLDQHAVERRYRRAPCGHWRRCCPRRCSSAASSAMSRIDAAGIALVGERGDCALSATGKPMRRAMSRAPSAIARQCAGGHRECRAPKKRLALIFGKRARHGQRHGLAAHEGIARPRRRVTARPYHVARAMARSARSGERKNARPLSRKQLPQIPPAAASRRPWSRPRPAFSDRRCRRRSHWLCPWRNAARRRRSRRRGLPIAGSARSCAAVRPRIVGVADAHAR